MVSALTESSSSGSVTLSADCQHPDLGISHDRLQFADCALSQPGPIGYVSE
jgi:hypothetical protein